VDLNSDGQEDALVHLQSPHWCGSCIMLVFKGTKSWFQFVSRSLLLRGPLLVSDTKTRGWRDLVVEVSGGGAIPKRVALKFDGKKYPLNPPTQKALPTAKHVKGAKVFEGQPYRSCGCFNCIAVKTAVKAFVRMG
jgi:putative lipoprotein